MTESEDVVDDSDGRIEEIEQFEREIEQLERENGQLRERLNALEAAVTGDDAVLSADDRKAESARELVTGGGTPTKVIGRLSDDDGIGVLGEATGSGQTIGVKGAVDSSTGYGLYTPDDANIEGDISTSDEFIAEVDGADNIYVTGLGSNGEAGNVFLGHQINWFASLIAESPVGATVSGGGKNNSQVTRPNIVYDDYGTVGGGLDNQVGTDDGDETSSRGATIGGGENNEATDTYATIGGGDGNKASGADTTVSGGDGNTATATSATVSGGHGNDATAVDATVSGGVGNDASAEGATVPGGRSNVADGEFSLAAGRNASANHDGSIVIGDSTTNSVSSKRQDEMRVQQELTAKEVSKENVGAKMTLGNEETIKSDETWYRIQFDNEEFDHFGWVDTANHVFTVSGPVTLQVCMSTKWGKINKTQDYQFRINKDNATIAAHSAFSEQHGKFPTDTLTTATYIPDGTTSTIDAKVWLSGVNDRTLSEAAARVMDFWVIKQG